MFEKQREQLQSTKAKYTASRSDVKFLKIPLCLHDLVSLFLDTYSGDYLSV